MGSHSKMLLPPPLGREERVRASEEKNATPAYNGKVHHTGQPGGRAANSGICTLPAPGRNKAASSLPWAEWRQRKPVQT